MSREDIVSQIIRECQSVVTIMIATGAWTSAALEYNVWRAKQATQTSRVMAREHEMDEWMIDEIQFHPSCLLYD